MYLFEKDRADANAQAYHAQEQKTRKVEDQFKRYKMRGMSKRLTINRNPEAK